jgi:L-alanine-DL-glutamate epimerase-like enolase superfamily enzyme
MADRPAVIDANPAAWCAVELAILDLLSRAAGQSIEAFLSRPSVHGRFQYSAVLGDAGQTAFRAMAEQFRGLGFSDFKVKLSGDLDRDREKLSVLRDWTGVGIRVDANNLWTQADEAIRFLRALGSPLFAVEEPIAANQYAELSRIAAELDCKIVLDESFLRVSQFDRLLQAPDRWLINLRVSKMGGLLRSLRIADAARAANVGLVIGAQVGETSVLTRAALTVAQASLDIVVAQEGAFGTHLLEHDVCEPVLMFGEGGILDTSRYRSLNQPGFGLSVSKRI